MVHHNQISIQMFRKIDKTHPPFLYFCCTYILVSYVGARGGILGVNGILDLWVMGKWFLMWGHQGILVLHHLLHNNHKFFALNFKCWGCLINSTSNVGDISSSQPKV
jgi:hypothetical protein